LKVSPDPERSAPRVMKVKAQAFLNAARYVEDTYGRPVLEEILRACSDDVRARHASALAIEWHPVTELVELLTATERRVGKGDGRTAEEIGAAGARVNFRGPLVRFAFYVGRPEFLMRRITSLWRQFNDEGEIVVERFAEGACDVELRGVTTTHPLLCASITGWCREICIAIVSASPMVRHTSCRAQGGRACRWELRWKAKGLKGQAKSDP
jgi:hypothetical protein